MFVLYNQVGVTEVFAAKTHTSGTLQRFPWCGGTQGLQFVLVHATDGSEGRQSTHLFGQGFRVNALSDASIPSKIMEVENDPIRETPLVGENFQLPLVGEGRVLFGWNSIFSLTLILVCFFFTLDYFCFFFNTLPIKRY